MTIARRLEAWEQTSRLMAATLSVWSKKPVKPDDLNPLAHLKRAPGPGKKLDRKRSFNLFARLIARS